MRILSVRIHNLNSLTGDWTIRLDGPEYEAGGIFAITGPTGAGKSTILDAICLALYGRTPRLDKVTKSSNEIMSRQTAECMAEVCFRTLRGEYRCCWSQNKAGKKISGNLQQPRHRLYDKDGLSLAEKTTDVVAKVTELTGMDFNRFTQSMLLAQGRFASFLLADGDERAPLLEQITGTGIYSEISRNVHERNRMEQLRLDGLNEELAAQNLLSEEEEATLAQEKSGLQAGIDELALREQALLGDLARVERAESLAREEATLAQEREQLHLDTEAFLPEQARLTLARRAAVLSGALQALDIRRDEQRRDEERARILNEELPLLRERELTAKASLIAAGKTLESEKDATEKARELWKRVRAADTELEARHRDMAALDLELAARRTALKHREQELNTIKREQKQAEDFLNRLIKEQEACAADAALFNVVGAVQARLSRLEEDENVLTGTRNILAELKQRTAVRETSLKESRNTAETLTRSLAEAQQRLSEARKNFAALLNGRDLPYWRNLRDSLSTRKTSLEKALDAALERETLLNRITELHRQQQNLILTVQKEDAELSAARERLVLLKEKLTLQAKIRSYEEERKLLREGRPCPLCGSVHHPFVERIPESDLQDRTADGVSELEARVEKLTAELAGHRRDAVHVASTLTENEVVIEEKTERLRRAVAGLSPALAAAFGGTVDSSSDIILPSSWEGDLLSALTLTERAPDLVPLLKRLSEVHGTRLSETESLLRRLDAQEEAGRDLVRKVESLRQEQENALLAVREGEKEMLTLAAETASRIRDMEDGMRRTEEGRTALNAMMRTFGIGGNTTAELKNAVQTLIGRRDHYMALQQQENAAREDLTERQRKLAVGEEALKTSQKECTTAEENRQIRQKELDTLASERLALFGRRKVDDEEAAAAERLQSLEKKEKSCRSALEQATRSLTESKSASSALTARMRQRSSALRDMEADLRERLTAGGFETEDACRSALLPEDRLSTLKRVEQALSDRSVSLEARAEALEQRRKEENGPVPDRQKTELRLSEARSEREEALRRLGSLQERLKANDGRKEQAERLRRQREAQAAVCRRWSALNDLIGSADGKKFRNYAQELTFRRLILMANRQLSFMTDRYVLTSSRDEALTINVIDRYQADTVRSSRNLSGGESFLVSLALALGLAQMASRNVRVDSVFLDEGFGTLDEESLGTALDMLAGLRRKGKVIGLISHVQAVRDRVGTQIRVEPAGNGRSRLSGPGVSGV